MDQPAEHRSAPGLLFALAAVVYALDRVTKVWAESALAGREPVEVIPGVLQLRFVTNPGGAFSLFGSVPWLFVAASAIAVVAIAVVSRRPTGRITAAGLGLILAGALGNLTDRAVRGPAFSGEVVDFVDLHVWPVFNVADMGIVAGVILVLFASARRERRVREVSDRGAEPEPADGR